VRYGLENLVEMDQYDWRELVKQDIIDEAFMFYQSMNEAWNYSCEFDHISGN
jgi:hypothetical protein